jgi:hypothetical protein
MEINTFFGLASGSQNNYLALASSRPQTADFKATLQ